MIAEALALAVVAGLVAFGVTETADHTLDAVGTLVRTPEQVLATAWRAYALWAVGIGAMAVGRAIGGRRPGGIRAAGALIPAVAAATGLGVIVQLGYGDPLHAADWPGERFADGVALGGLAAGLLLAVRFDIGEWLDRGERLWVGGIVATFLALALFGTGPAGSSARITLGPIQPLELVKVAFVLFLAAYLGRRAPAIRWHRHATWGGRLQIPRPRLLLPALGVLLVLFAGLFLVRDLGPTLVLSLVFLVVLYLVTRSPGWVGIAVGTVTVLLAGIVSRPDVVGSERVAVRLQMWLHPWLNGLPNGDQLAQARWAIAAGGFGGSGIGRGHLLPAGHTDLAIAHLAEELGFLGIGGYLAAIAVIVAAGMTIAERNRTPERALAAAGLSLLLASQIVVILGGTTGMLPLTGIVVPFLSSGRTSTTVFVLLVGLLVKLGEGGQVRADTETLGELRRTVRGASGVLAGVAAVALGVLFVEGVVLGPSTNQRGVVTTLGDGTIAVRYDPRVLAIAARIPRGSLLDRNGKIIAGTDETGARTWPLGDALGTLLGPPTPEVLRPAWGLERIHDLRLRGYGERDDGPAVWMADDRLLFAVPSRVERPADRRRAQALAPSARLLPLPSPDLSGLVRLLHASDTEIQAIAEDVGSRSVQLTLDAELQDRSSVLLAHWAKKAKAAAAVVIDVDTGQVLVRAQVPDYDPGDPAWRAPVRARDPVYTGVYGPWTDKTGAMGTVQAGSVAKLLTAVAAVRTGAVTWEGDGCEIRSAPAFDCTESDRQGPLFTREGWSQPIHDHSHDPTHGTLDLTEALAVSCNVYFGQLGLALGPDPLASLVTDGVDIGWSSTFEPGAADSRTLASTAFGQGAAAMSASQAARLVALVGGGGTYRKCPSDLRLDATCAETAVVADPRALTPVLAGLSAVMTRGTGRTLPAIPGVRVYGKTGTADAVGLEEEAPYGITAGDRHAETHSWFVALAEPDDAPECGVRTSGRLAVAVLVARGGSGRAAAAPAAVDILRAAHELGWLTTPKTAEAR